MAPMSDSELGELKATRKLTQNLVFWTAASAIVVIVIALSTWAIAAIQERTQIIDRMATVQKQLDDDHNEISKEVAKINQHDQSFATLTAQYSNLKDGQDRMQTNVERIMSRMGIDPVRHK